MQKQLTYLLKSSHKNIALMVQLTGTKFLSLTQEKNKLIRCKTNLREINLNCPPFSDAESVAGYQVEGDADSLITQRQPGGLTIVAG